MKKPAALWVNAAAALLLAVAAFVGAGCASADDQSYEAGYALVTHQPGLFTDSIGQGSDGTCRHYLEVYMAPDPFNGQRPKGLDQKAWLDGCMDAQAKVQATYGTRPGGIPGLPWVPCIDCRNVPLPSTDRAR
jgi:hypothetical protein